MKKEKELFSGQQIPNQLYFVLKLEKTRLQTFMKIKKMDSEELKRLIRKTGGEKE